MDSLYDRRASFPDAGQARPLPPFQPPLLSPPVRFDYPPLPSRYRQPVALPSLARPTQPTLLCLRSQQAPQAHHSKPLSFVVAGPCLHHPSPSPSALSPPLHLLPSIPFLHHLPPSTPLLTRASIWLVQIVWPLLASPPRLQSARPSTQVELPQPYPPPPLSSASAYPISIQRPLVDLRYP